MKRFPMGFRAFLGMAVLAAATGCGGLYGGGGGGGNVEVIGEIEAIFPDDTDREIVVFVYRVKDEPADCTEPELPDNKAEKDQTLDLGETEFDLNKIRKGRLVIAFLLDNPGKDADGRIDPGDPVAVLNDPDCVLDDVPPKYVVEAHDVRINFSLDDDVIGFPESGRAEAGDLSEGPRP